MPIRFLTALAAATSAVLAGAAPAMADPAPAPPPFPNVMSYIPLNGADYAVNGGKWFAFAGPPGVVCILNNLTGEYGCSGPLPGAPEGTNLVSAGPAGVPAFSTTPQPAYAAAGPVKVLPPRTRLTFRQITCGVDEDGVVACLNARDLVGFVVGPTSSYINPGPPPPPPAPAPVPPAGS